MSEPQNWEDVALELPPDVFDEVAAQALIDGTSMGNVLLRMYREWVDCGRPDATKPWGRNA